jgi:hypothetical protein
MSNRYGQPYHRVDSLNFEFDKLYRREAACRGLVHQETYGSSSITILSPPEAPDEHRPKSRCRTSGPWSGNTGDLFRPDWVVGTGLIIDQPRSPCERGLVPDKGLPPKGLENAAG